MSPTLPTMRMTWEMKIELKLEGMVMMMVAVVVGYAKWLRTTMIYEIGAKQL